MLFVLNYSQCSIESLHNGCDSLKIGLTVEEKYLDTFSLDISEPVYKRPSKLSVICPIRHSFNGKIIGDFAEEMLRFIMNNNIKIDSELFYVNEISFHQNGEEHFYSKLYIPIE